jgi:phytoene/squalene synthetase
VMMTTYQEARQAMLEAIAAASQVAAGISDHKLNAAIERAKARFEISDQDIEKFLETML